MQSFLGTSIFIVVCLIAFLVSLGKSVEYSGTAKLVMIPAWWAGGIATFYAGATFVAIILWVIAWIGIYLRYIALWIIGTVLYPWSWIF
jgi:hypothetical protein